MSVMFDGWKYFNRNLVLIFSLLLISLISVHAKSSKDLIAEIDDLSNGIYYNTEAVIDSFYRIYEDINELKQKKLIAYSYYFDAYKAYSQSDYQKSISLSDSALQCFIWKRNKEWESKSLLLLAFSSEALLIDDYALDYYETCNVLSQDYGLKGLSKLGIARSRKRLSMLYQDDLDCGIELLNKTGKREFELLALRSYYWFNRTDATLDTALENVANEYIQLNLPLHASSTKKLISYYYKSIGEYKKANKYADQSVRILSTTKDSTSVFFGSLLLYRSSLLFMNGNDSLALKDVKKSIVIHSNLGLKHQNYYAFQDLSEYYRGNNQFQLADSYSQLAIMADKKIDLIKRSSNATLAKILINRTYVERQLARNKKMFYVKLVVVLILVLIFIKYLISKFRHRIKIKDVEVVELQKNNLKLNNVYIELLSIVKKLEKESSLSKASKDFEKRIAKDSELSSSLSENFCSDYQKSICNFAFQHPKLTESEVRTAVMIAMNLPFQSILKLLCIEADTLKTYRKRIRKKMCLKPEDKLNDHLKHMLYEMSN